MDLGKSKNYVGARMKLEYEANYLPTVDATCPNEEFENAIRKIGVGHACEYFGYHVESWFTEETFKWLKDCGEQI